MSAKSHVPREAHSQPDDIYPVHLLDSMKSGFVLVAWVMRFNDVLDVEKLYSSLSTLLEQGDWRKLGGRLKAAGNGKLELHVPRPFTADRPAVAFTKDDFSTISIHEHELASQFPEPQESPYAKVIYDQADFRCFAAPDGFPSTVKEMMARDVPQIGLRTTSFNDATLVSLVWPHTLMDGMGQTALLQSWSLMLAGKQDQIPQVIGAREDVLNQLGTMPPPDEPLEIDSHYPSRLGLISFIFKTLWRRFFYSPKQTRIIFLPRRAVDELKRTAKEEADGTFLSEGDVLTAWICKAIASAEPEPHPLTVLNLMNARGRLPWLTTKGVYLQNMVGVAGTYLSAQQSRASIGDIATEHRRQIAKQATAEQVTLFFQDAWKRLLAKQNPRMAFIGETDSRVMFTNNLTKASYIQVTDFSPAVIRQGQDEKTRINPSGTMVNYMHLVMKGPIKLADNFYIVGKDHAGNYWLMGTVSDQAWARFDEALEALQ
ncbi:hypothetical protein FQN54_009087 [Arachnomyces sp. PD_36]|nr:hypothetical protein FQN54_009087 [Arachnomyces sp. PD_36]